MTRTRRLALSALLTAIPLAASGCGGTTSQGAGSGQPAGTTGSAHRVVISDFAFHPSTLTVPAGTKVTFVNEDSTVHTATGSGGFDSGNLQHGQSYTYTFTKAGTYNYICTIHQYMHATVVVTGK